MKGLSDVPASFISFPVLFRFTSHGLDVSYQRGRSPFAQIALLSSLMLWQKVVPLNWHITPDLCLATSWLHELIYTYRASWPRTGICNDVISDPSVIATLIGSRATGWHIRLKMVQIPDEYCQNSDYKVNIRC
jgi:hypothetical protein